MRKRKSGSLIVAFLLSFVLFTGAIPVNAQAIPSTQSVTRGALCPDCNIGSIVTTYGSWGVWYNDHEVTCTHYPHGTDMIQARSRSITSKCNYCGNATVSLGKEYRTICHGYRY